MKPLCVLASLDHWFVIDKRSDGGRGGVESVIANREME